MNLNFYDSLDEQIVHTLHFPAQPIGQDSPVEIELHLWNRKDKTCNWTATDIEIFTRTATDLETGDTVINGQEIVTEGLIEAKSYGVVGTGITDDGQTLFTPVTETASMSIGDIPVNCARKIFFRLKSISGNSTRKALFLINILYNYLRKTAYKVVEHTSENLFIGEDFIGDFL
jgi:hypothetical protein